MRRSRTNLASVGNAFKGTRKVLVLSLPEIIKQNLTFRAKAFRREVSDEGLSLDMSIFLLSFQVVKELLCIYAKGQVDPLKCFNHSSIEHLFYFRFYVVLLCCYILEIWNVFNFL